MPTTGTDFISGAWLGQQVLGYAGDTGYSFLQFAPYGLAAVALLAGVWLLWKRGKKGTKSALR